MGALIRRVGNLILGTAILVALPRPAAAQTGRVGLEATVGYYLPGGSDFDGFDNAFGFDAVGSYALAGGLELGGGVELVSHDLDGTLASSADVLGLFAEGRYRFGVPARTVPHLHPFVSGRVGWSRLKLSDDAVGDRTASGLLLGVGGGIEYWFTDEVAATGAARFHLLDYGNSDDLPDLSGNRFDIRAGLKVRF